MSVRALVFVLLTAALAAAAPTPGIAKPWQPRTFRVLPEVPGEGPMFVIFEPEYRTRLIGIDPLEVNGVVAQGVMWGEQRMRVQSSVGVRGVGAIHLQADVLDGVLFGDNGEFGRAPEPTTGVGISSKQANLSGWRVGLLPGADPLSVEGYGPVLRPLEPVNINFLYGEVLLPFGVLRIGRQPISENGTVSLNDGQTGRNRWGASWFHQSSDRVLFGTKISELFNIIAEGSDYLVDPSTDNGVFLGLVWDFLVDDDIAQRADNLQGMSAQLDFKWKRPEILGPAFGPMRLTATLTYRFDDRFDTSIFALPIRGSFSIEDFHLSGELTYITGTTRELSAGFGALTNSPVTDQEIRLLSSRIFMDYELGDFTFALEWGYAAGDDDPRTTTPLEITTWPRDTNLGLLLFEHTLAFQSARSAAVGIENLRKLEADSFPLTEIATDGRVTNVSALFPQIFYDPDDSLRLKLGVLFAWAAADVVDPIQTLLRQDGDEISDDAVNYHGGKPGRYWGTELDMGLSWRYREFFQADFEMGILFPGSALEDENGDAVTSWMLESRFTFRL